VRSFHFPLERVLEFQKKRKKWAEVKQQQAALARRAAEQAVALVKEQVKVRADFVAEQLRLGNVSASWFAGHQQIEKLSNDLKAAEHRARKAAELFSQANKEREKIAQAVEMLLTLRTKRLHDHKQALSRAEQVLLDELGLRLAGGEQ